MAETSAATPNSEFSNYFRLLKLLHKSSDVLRHLFVTQWNSMNSKKKWEDSDSNRQEFINGLGKALHKKSQKIQREYLSSRNIADWDLPLLIKTAKCLQVKAPFEIFEQLRLLRNKLSHLGEPKVNDEKYNEYWKEISILLLKLDIQPEEIDKVLSTRLKQIDPSSEKLDPKARELRDMGNEAFKKALYDTSIDHYTDAILLPGLSSKDLALLYANRSVAFLKSGDIRSAKDDAKVSIHLCPAWWKGYYRLAKAYIADDKYQLALKNFILAQEFHEKASKLDEDIDLCKRLIVQQSREEHFDAIYFSKTYEELAKCVPNLTSELMKLGDNKFGKASGMCRQGHSHRLSRDLLLQDDKEAASWYSKAAAEGNAEGMYNLAIMTIFGTGIQNIILEGILLLNKAASQPKIIELLNEWNIPNFGVSEAQHSLGFFYEQGFIPDIPLNPLIPLTPLISLIFSSDIPKNYEKAKYWYTLAIRNWSGSSANNMAIMYISGKLGPVSIDLAFQYWKLGAAMGNVRCMENLAENYFLRQDYEHMQKWCLYAVEHGSTVITSKSGQKYKDYFQEDLTNNFKREEFTTSLWDEIKSGQLIALVDYKVKAMYDRLRDARNEFSADVPKVSLQKIDLSSAAEYRKAITLAHRKSSKDLKSAFNILDHFNTPSQSPKRAFKLSNLKPIFLQDMKEKNVDHIYEDYVLKLTIMEDPLVIPWKPTPFINSIVCDEQGSYERLCVYNYNPSKEELQKNLGFGTTISIRNPYYKIISDEMKAIFVDDFSTIFVHHHLKNEKICRYCGDKNDTEQAIPCRSCKKCYYCSKKCLRLDVLELEHDITCKKVV